ncbi:DUF1641 domain-containing protein [Thermodesulfobacteriota bacterium]
MTNEDLILQKIENLEAEIAPIVQASKSIMELKADLLPLQNQAIGLLINELKDVEAGFKLEDLFVLIKQMMRSVNNFTYALRQMQMIIEFVNDLEPLLKSAVPQIIHYLDDLEQKGVFRIIKAMMDARAKVAATYDAEDIDQIGDVLVFLLGLAQKLNDPGALGFLEKAAEIPANIDFSQTKKVGPMGLMSAGFNKDVKEGFGVLLELTKALGKLKPNGQGAPLKGSSESLTANSDQP